MKKLSIYIDHAGNNELHKKVINRLKKLEGICNVITYQEIGPEPEAEDINNEWERVTVDAIEKSDIIIPILSENYLSFISPKIETLFNKIIDSKDKFLFPILLTPSEWGSFKWVVRSKLIPQDGIPLSEHTEDDTEIIISGLIKTIKNIQLKRSKPQVEKVIDSQNVSSEDNVIFISHNHDDADFAELLKLKLEKSKLNGWIDSERLKIGQDWREEIDIGIQNSIAVIAIMTPEARKSEYVTYEWAYAWGKGKKVFPLMLKQTQLHPRLESLQYLDFTNRASRPWDELINSIKEIIK